MNTAPSSPWPDPGQPWTGDGLTTPALGDDFIAGLLNSSRANESMAFCATDNPTLYRITMVSSVQGISIDCNFLR